MNASSYEVRSTFVFVALIDCWLVWIAEQELVVHLSDSTIRQFAFAVEPRQLALSVRFCNV
jgi:hypothetical protein